ncbi:MAG: alpha/beta fold hydrolase [Spirochaetia bacterium]
MALFKIKIWQIVIVILIGILGYSVSCSHMPEIRNEQGQVVEGSITEMEQIEVNGTQQWIYIRSHSDENPVLLFLAGGPGGSEIGWTQRYNAELEESYTMVGWDQRGVAKSWSAMEDWSDVTADTFVDDVIAVSEYLTQRFNTNRIFLAGHSWGSIIGIMAAHRRPDLYHAYIGIAQQVNSVENDLIGYRMVLEGARREGNEDLVFELEDNGPPPYTVEETGNYLVLFTRLSRYSPHSPDMVGTNPLWMLTAPEHTLIDRINLVRAVLAGVNYVYPQLADMDFEETIPQLQVPVYFITGRYDYTCVASITERYFNSLEAPYKQLVWFEDSGHNPCYQEADRFNEFMSSEVIRWAAQ